MFRMKLEFFLFWVCCVVLIVSEGSSVHHEHQHEEEFGGDEESARKRKEHIQDHAEDYEDVSNMTKEEQDMYYFQMVDYDKDMKLDGLDIIKYMIHEDGHAAPSDKRPKLTPDEILGRYTSLIDTVFHNTDLNFDGYLEFFEFQRYLKTMEIAHAQPKQK